jgi:hypothetical protein
MVGSHSLTASPSPSSLSLSLSFFHPQSRQIVFLAVSQTLQASSYLSPYLHFYLHGRVFSWLVSYHHSLIVPVRRPCLEQPTLKWQMCPTVSATKALSFLSALTVVNITSIYHYLLSLPACLLFIFSFLFCLPLKPDLPSAVSSQRVVST